MSLLTSRVLCGIPASSCSLIDAGILSIGRSSASITRSIAQSQRNASTTNIMMSSVSSSVNSFSHFSSLCFSSFPSQTSQIHRSFSTQNSSENNTEQTQQTNEQKPSNGNGNGAKSETSNGSSSVEIEKLKSDLAKTQEQLDHCRRFAADLDNQRKRALEEAKKERLFAIQSFAKALLDVADTLEFALKDGKAAQDKETEAFKNVVVGIEMTMKNLEKAFEKGGLKKMNALNEAFDPHRHEAIVQLENANVAPNTVVEVFKAGYVLQERTLRAAQVATSKKPAQP